MYLLYVMFTPTVVIGMQKDSHTFRLCYYSCSVLHTDNYLLHVDTYLVHGEVQGSDGNGTER